MEETEKESSVTPNCTEEQQPKLSKNALKRLKKKAEHESTKKEWRAKIRDKRKASRKRRVQELIEQGLPLPKRFKPGDMQPAVGKVLFDLGYEGLMNEREVASLCSQIHRCYSTNRRHEKPFEFLISNFKGSVADKFKRSFPEHVNWTATVTEDDLAEVLAKDPNSAVIYLSADATEELEEIKDTDTIIIGGIVDRNRNKCASLNRATGANIRAVRLPLEKHISLKTCKVLTVLHVFEILLKYRQSGSWAEAITSSIPERKVATTSSEALENVD